jgi:alpha-L-rhamnosidase
MSNNTAHSRDGSIQVLDLRVDGISEARGLGDARPHLSWRLESPARGVRQIAFRVRVASDSALARDDAADVWDSGRVEDTRTVGIPLDGTPLESRGRYWWTVEVWCAGRSEPVTSAPASWTMGLLTASDWSAEWLAAEDPEARADREHGLSWVWGEQPDGAERRLFRHTFELPHEIEGGELLVVVNDWPWFAQITDVSLDGESFHAGPVWSPPANELDSAILTRRTFQLPRLRAGRHVLAVGTSFDPFATPNNSQHLGDPVRIPVIAALAVLGRLRDPSGAAVRIGANGEWRTTTEVVAGWDSPDLDDSTWDPALHPDLSGHQPLSASPATLLRTTFDLVERPSSATLYITALGGYEARINGERVGDDVLAPGTSQYLRRTRVRTYDVADLLQVGANALGLCVGDGWFAGFDGRFVYAPPPRRVLAQLEIEHADGTREVIATGPGWHSIDGPIRSSGIQSGEFYDARYERPGWDRPGSAIESIAGWVEALPAARPDIRLDADADPPVRVIEQLAPASITPTETGEYVVDFGRDVTGWCRLRAGGEAGTVIELRFGQRCVDGRVDQSNSRDPRGFPRTDTIVLNGDPDGVEFEPRFTYRAFRYVEIAGLTSAPDPDAITAVRIHSDLPVTAAIESDPELVQDIFEAIVLTQRSTFVDYPHDNAIRESRGYLGDAALFVDTSAFVMDVQTFTARKMVNIADEQRPDGSMPSTAPQPRHSNASHNMPGSAPGWGDAAVIIPWTTWQHYGDPAIIEDSWPVITRFLDFVLARNADLVWMHGRGHDYGDWYTSHHTPADLIANAYWAYSLRLAAEMADAIGRPEEAAEYARLRAGVADNFAAAHVASDGTVGNGSQTGYVLALHFGVVPAGLRDQAAIHLAADVAERGLTTGLLGTEHLLDVLADTGHGRVAYDLLLSEKERSWGYMIRHGATAIWEDWDGRQSTAQPTLATIGGFLFRHFAGIVSTSPGYGTFDVSPLLDPRLRRGGGTYESATGRIATRWRVDDDRYRLRVDVPPNATARIHLPGAVDGVAEGDRLLQDSPDLGPVLESSGVTVGSGVYEFATQVPLPRT